MAKPPSLLSEVRFGAFLVYSPRGTSAISRRSRDWCYSIKSDIPPAISKVVQAMVQTLDTTPLADILSPEVTLVPAPKSALLVEGALWTPRRIAEELIGQGLGKEILPCVRRVTAVPKSASAGWGQRPSPQTHFESMAADPVLAKPSRVTVVDDVVTKGATLLAAASHVRGLFPSAEVRAFALVRTMGLTPDVERIVDSCVGYIRLGLWGDAVRDP